jgi:outer membrane lipopolysaccharide assembly protein LptE/RlpB
MRSLSLFIISCLLLVLSGCGYSLHTTASLPFQSIQIVRIENKTVEPKLQDRLYNALTEEFLKEGIAVSTQAGYKLRCTIDHFELKLLAERSNVATDYEVIIKANFELTDPSGKKKEFKDIGAPFIVSFAGAGPLDELLASKEVASDRAIKDMATEIVGLLIYR